jgi:uncharacterized protein with GYD domain
MATYFLFGKYSLEALNAISAQRTEDAADLVKKHGGKIKAAYALLGDVDLVLIVELPDTERAMQTSVALSRMLGIAFTTAPAVSAEQFDQLLT